MRRFESSRPPTSLDHQAYQEEAALLVPIAHRSILTESRLPRTISVARLAKRPVSMRVSGTDWAEGGWDLDQTIAFAKVLAARGCSASRSVSSLAMIRLRRSLELAMPILSLSRASYSTIRAGRGMRARPLARPREHTKKNTPPPPPPPP